jgi:hypothetical protein
MMKRRIVSDEERALAEERAKAQPVSDCRPGIRGVCGREDCPRCRPLSVEQMQQAVWTLRNEADALAAATLVLLDYDLELAKRVGAECRKLVYLHDSLIDICEQRGIPVHGRLGVDDE